MRFIVIFSIFLLCIFSTHKTHADCINLTRSEGTLVYNHDYGLFQGCTAAGWVGLNRPTKTPPPQGCDNIGDICTGTHAGMIYAAVFEGNKLYIAGSDAPELLSWGPIGDSGMGFCSFSSPTPPCKTGKENTDYLVNLPAAYPAAEYCANLNAHSYGPGKWYLPSYEELRKISLDLRATGKVESFNFQTIWYWASSENNANAGAGFRLGELTGGGWSKGGKIAVRCITR